MSTEHIDPKIQAIVADFLKDMTPIEAPNALIMLADNRTGARYYECHVRGSQLVAKATTNVPLDPTTQPEYRANRDVVTDHPAFMAMKEDAQNKRSFSNIVTEYTKDFGNLPLKIIGGQHRFEAIKLAHQNGVNEVHGIKVYFGLDMDQRLDVQTISNTNVAISGAMADRLNETYRGGALRKWCQATKLLGPEQDFADKPAKGAITVNLARTFVENYYRGKDIATDDFPKSDTTPILYKIGKDDDVWGNFLQAHQDFGSDPALLSAGKEFAKLISAQQAAYEGVTGQSDSAQKATNAAVLSAWAYTAGFLQQNPVRLTRHYELSANGKKDPLNADALAKGKHKTDLGTNYRGLGARTDPRERGQMVELFVIQAEKGKGITTPTIRSAIDDWFAKKYVLEALKSKAKIDDGD